MESSLTRAGEPEPSSGKRSRGPRRGRHAKRDLHCQNNTEQTITGKRL